MKYFVIAGEPSGDLHAGHLMEAIGEEDPEAEVRYWYRPELAYMGFVNVALHLGEILRGMKECREAILGFRPDRLVLVDYPGFNLKIATWFSRTIVAQARQAEGALVPKIVYYIPPKVWAWKEGRVKQIKKHVDLVLGILPFEVEWYARRYDYHVDYVGNPTLDEIDAFRRSLGQGEVEMWRQGLHLDARPILALMPGSRTHEVVQNLPLMLRAAREVAGDVQCVVAQAPSLDVSFYNKVIASALPVPEDEAFRRSVVLAPCQGSRSSFLLLHNAHAALVTSGTATLETAIAGVPQVVCYAMRCGRVASWLRKLVLKVPFVSLVNLIANSEVVPELVAGDLSAERLRQELKNALHDEAYRARQREGYARVMELLGQPGAPRRAAKLVVSGGK